MTEVEVVIVSEMTRVDVQRLKDIAVSIGALLDHHGKPFDQLYGFTPDLGDFDAARWLGDLVTDRRDTVLAHLAYLRRTLAEINAALERIAGDLEETDAANAAALTHVNTPANR